MHIFTVPMVSERCLIQNSIWGIMVFLNERKRSIDKITTEWHFSLSYRLDESLQIEEICSEVSSEGILGEQTWEKKVGTLSLKILADTGEPCPWQLPERRRGWLEGEAGELCSVF